MTQTPEGQNSPAGQMQGQTPAAPQPGATTPVPAQQQQSVIFRDLASI